MLTQFKSSDAPSNTWVIKGNHGYDTEGNIVSAEIDVSSTGIQSITTAHGLDETPGIGNVSATIYRSNTHIGAPIAQVWVDSVDATNIVCKVNVGTAGNAADRMKITMRVDSSTY